MSGCGESETLTSLVQRPRTQFIEKPFSKKQLLERLGSLLGGSTPPAAP